MASESDQATSNACRLREWRAKRRAQRRQVCADCGGIFTPNRSQARFCSVGCKQRSYRRRRSALGGPEMAAGGETRAAAPGPALRDRSSKVFDVEALIG